MFHRGPHGVVAKARAARAAHLFFLVQPIRLFVDDVGVALDVGDAVEDVSN